MTLLTTEKKNLLNRFMGRLAKKVALGDLIEDALQVASTELTSIGDGKMLVGAPTTGLATAVTISGDITISNAGVAAIGADAVDGANIAGGSIDEEHLSASLLENAPGQMVLDFTTQGCVTGGSGAMGVAVVTDNAVNCIMCGSKHLQWHNINQNDLGVCWVAGSGLNIAGDQTDNDGLEINCGDTASDVQKTVDTDNFYFRAKLSLADASGTDGLCIGVRKAQAHQNAIDSYTDFYGVAITTNADPAELKIRSNINNGGAAETDTTQTLADGQYIDVKIWVGDEARLQTAIDLATDMKAKMNTHYADQGGAGEEHIAADTAIASSAPTTVATLITIITEMMASYVAHEADAHLGADWVYHQADNADDDSLTSEVAPTTLAECVTRLNDLKAKFALHVADATAHTAGDNTGSSKVNACNTYLQLGVNGALADPTAARGFDFDADDTVVPFIHMTQHGDLTGAAYLSAFEVVDVTTT